MSFHSVIAARDTQRPSALANLISRTSPRARLWILFAVVATVAIGLRLYAIQGLPPGLFGDEAVEGLDALDVLAGNWSIWFHAHLGREPIFVYLVALSYAVLGISPLATRLPAIIAGLLTLPATFLLVREWAAGFSDHDRANRLAWLTTILVAISFWHVQMTRDAHRDTLLPLVEAVGYWLLWYALHSGKWQAFAAAGGVLGLSVYIYSPGRFVAVFIFGFVLVEWICRRLKLDGIRFDLSRLLLAGAVAILVMVPLALYFVQNPAQFGRRFESVSVFDADSPANELATSIVGNMAQFVVPGAGYQSKHYNLPGKSIFDLFIAPWFLVGIGMALRRARRAEYRFLLLWFVVMMVPAFVTADMIPKAVRALGTVPGVFVFPALSMNSFLEWAERKHTAAKGLLAVCLIGSALWTTFDYFVVWANMPELPLAFDADMTEVAAFLQKQPADQQIHISTEVYRPPTEMLLGRHTPTSRYVDQATRIKEFDAKSGLLLGKIGSDPLFVFVRDQRVPPSWLTRVVREVEGVEEGTYFQAAHLRGPIGPQRRADIDFSPWLKLSGYSMFEDEPRGIVLYWQVTTLPEERQDMMSKLVLRKKSGDIAAEAEEKVGLPPLEWVVGDSYLQWYVLDGVGSATEFMIELSRGTDSFKSTWLPLN